MGEPKVHRYAGNDAVVTWDESLCMHAAECVRGAPAVFQPKARPWIDPDAAAVDALAATVARCPSGALKLFRPDGTLIVASQALRHDAAVPGRPTVVKVRPDGPNVFEGDFVVVVVTTAQGTRNETLAFMCRCGASKNKPFCDGSHKKVGFRHGGTLSADVVPGISVPGKVTVTPLPNGPLECTGPLTVEGSDGRRAASGETWLCRCGNSQNKPYCDGTHKKIGFIA
jgi:CDGSH-type Zn-finger protein/uncharacterized Fe-S cluster protein YjdI